MHVTLRQLRAFLAVARTGSFSAAAEGLFVTQSALSSLIKELEGALGVRLIDRLPRQVRLSEIGRDLFPVVDKIVQDLDRALTDVADFKFELVNVHGLGVWVTRCLSVCVCFD